MSGNAFKNHPKELQPQSIRISDYDQLAHEVHERFDCLGEIKLPSIRKYKMLGKDTTGDIDILIHPKDTSAWTHLIRDVAGDNLLIGKKNGCQFMTSQTGFSIGGRYFLDFIFCKSMDDFAWKTMYYHRGICVPAVIGSFARSLSYKFSNTGLYKRVKDLRGIFHNVFLTNDFDDACKVLGLPIHNKLLFDGLYTPEGVAEFIMASSRFNADLWNRPNIAGREITVKNRKSHAAIKKSPAVTDCYNVIDKCELRSYNAHPNDEFYEMLFLTIDEVLMINKIRTEVGMSEIKLAIDKDLRKALRSRDPVRIILSVVKGEIDLEESKGKALSNDQIIKKLEKMVASNEACLEVANTRGDISMSDKLGAENEVLKSYIPTKMTKLEIEKELGGIIDKIKSADRDGMAVGIAMGHVKKNGLNASGSDVKDVVENIRG